jgi:GNAT superfamily N-acetyltransferase
MLIRKAKKNDTEAIFLLAKEFASSFIIDQQSFEHSFSQLYSAPNTRLFVVTNESQVIGYCLGFIHQTFYANGKVAWLEEVVVKSEWRRKGAASLLMNQFEAWAKTEGATLNALATRRASEFYNAIGYEASATYFRKIL